MVYLKEGGGAVSRLFVCVRGGCDAAVGNLLYQCTYKGLSSSCAITPPPSASSLEPDRVSKKGSGPPAAAYRRAVCQCGGQWLLDSKAEEYVDQGDDKTAAYSSLMAARLLSARN